MLFSMGKKRNTLLPNSFGKSLAKHCCKLPRSPKIKKQNEAEWGAFHVVPQGRAEALNRRSKSFVTEDSIGAVTQVTEKR